MFAYTKGVDFSNDLTTVASISSLFVVFVKGKVINEKIH